MAGRGRLTSSRAVPRCWSARRSLARARSILGEAFDAAQERISLLANFLAQSAQDAFDLALFLENQRAPAIGHLDDRQGLDEERRSAGRLVVHDAGHLAAGLGADRDHVAASPLRHHWILDDVAIRCRRHDLAQAPSPGPVVCATQLGPQATEGRAGGIQHVAAFADGILDILGQARMVAEIHLG